MNGLYRRNSYRNRKMFGGKLMKKKKIALILMLSALTIFLAGCGDFREPIYSDTEGFWSKFIVWPIVAFITMLKDVLGTYGWSIVAVTIIVRVILLPLIIQQANSSKAMRDIQPKMKALQEKYKSKDAVTQEKYREAIQQLFTENQVNPVAGCLPALVQMPIIIGLYHAISRMNATPEIELGTFLGFQLAEQSIVLAILAGVAQFVVLKTGPAMDNPQMKTMLYIMPFMIVGFGLFLPAAISLYWIIGNVIMLITNIFLYKPFAKEPVIVEEQKKNNRKKGGKRKK